MDLRLTREQEQKLNSYMNLVGKVYAKNHTRLFSNCSADAEDYMQIGRIALCKAAKSYDETLGYSFATFATSCIRNAMIDYSIKMAAKKSLIHNNAASAEYLAENAKEFANGAYCEIDTSMVGSIEIIIREIMDDEVRQCEKAKAEGKAKCESKTKRIGLYALIEAMHGRDTADIANDFGINESTLRCYMTRAREFLKNNPKFVDYVELYLAS